MDATSTLPSANLPIGSGLIGANGTLAPGAKPTLRAAAAEMETMFLSLLMKEMRQTLESDGGLFAGDGGDVYGGLFDFYMGKHLADSGGVGLARSMIATMERTHPESPHDAPRSAAPGADLPRSFAP
jgi:peptidoglycan hydrolase FlgJ